MYFYIKCIGNWPGPASESSDPWCSRQASSSDQSSTVYEVFDGEVLKLLTVKIIAPHH